MSVISKSFFLNTLEFHLEYWGINSLLRLSIPTLLCGIQL
jgi:hypothetical protein